MTNDVNFKKTLNPRPNLVYIRYTIKKRLNLSKLRRSALKAFKKIGQRFRFTAVNQDQYWEEIKASKFVLSPPGELEEEERY